MQKYVILAKKSIPEASARGFEIKYRGEIFQGFVARKNNRYYAYRNLCQHLPITLDLKDNNFFTHDGNHLQCHMHGAMYEVDSGVCVAGPCEGAKLIPLEMREEENDIVVEIPERF